MESINRRIIPSVDKVLRELGPTGLPRPALVALVRQQLAGFRGQAAPMAEVEIIACVRASLDRLVRARLGPVINGTGILIHTNLGRAPLGGGAVNELAAVAANYNTLEYDTQRGERGSRGEYVEFLLAALCEARAAMVVNNCAAALVLILRNFLRPPRTEVIISRGELVQIGGGFRIPEILEAAGVTLREVGTTNRTVLADYAQALEKDGAARVALVLKVHRSNFYMDGFVDSPPTAELAALARRHKIPLAEDLGSGATRATALLDLNHPEPTAADVLGEGADLVCFSGDKLLGGPQAGIIAEGGRKARYVPAMKRHPFFRALRCDKLILAALQATVEAHLRGASEEIPILMLLRTSLEELELRAKALVAALAALPIRAMVGHGHSKVGGGALPRTTMPTICVDLIPESISLQVFAAGLRASATPIISSISGNRVRLDMRTIFPHQDALVMAAVRELLMVTAIGDDV